MFNKKKLQIFQLKTRVKELEDILCPFNQHEYVETHRYIDTDFDGNMPDSYYRRALQCRRCKKIVHDTDRFGGFNYKTVDAK